MNRQTAARVKPRTCLVCGAPAVAVNMFKPSGETKLLMGHLPGEPTRFAFGTCQTHRPRRPEDWDVLGQKLLERLLAGAQEDA